jgi:hypothetical protein
MTVKHSSGFYFVGSCPTGPCMVTVASQNDEPLAARLLHHPYANQAFPNTALWLAPCFVPLLTAAAAANRVGAAGGAPADGGGAGGGPLRSAVRYEWCTCVLKTPAVHQVLMAL